MSLPSNSLREFVIRMWNNLGGTEIVSSGAGCAYRFEPVNPAVSRCDRQATRLHVGVRVVERVNAGNPWMISQAERLLGELKEPGNPHERPPFRSLLRSAKR